MSVLGAFVLTTLMTLPPTTSTLPSREDKKAPEGPVIVTAMPVYEWAQAEIPYSALPK